jgi:hypothetical protein
MMEQSRTEVAAILAGNRAIREEMMAFIASKEALAFVGAGMSVGLGYPGWGDLLTKLRRQAEALDPAFPFVVPVGLTENDALDFAEAIQRHFEAREELRRYRSALGHEFARKPGGCTALLHKLVKLPFKGYLTTNYDPAVECALNGHGNTNPDCGVVIKSEEDAHMVSEFLRGLDKPKHARQVGHLHGRHDQTESIILTRSDYKRAYGFVEAAPGEKQPDPEWRLHRKLVWSLLATRTVVFWGCSLTDPYLIAMLNAVANDLWHFGQRVHFAVVALDSRNAKTVEVDTEQFLGRYGLQLVFYDNSDGSRLELERLVGEALQRCGAPEENDWIEAVNRETERKAKPYED